jgi:tetratricopeptide (TPR) repeat protein
MTQFTAPPSVIQNIARAKSLVKRDEPVRAIDALIRALELFHPEDIIGKARFEAEVAIQECVNDLSRHPKVYAFLRDLTKSSHAAISYKPGEEAKLLPVLAVLRKALAETEAAGAHAARQKVEDRKMMLLEKGKTHLAVGETPRGKGVLRQLAEEFGTEPGILFEVGSLLAGAKLPYDALEFLEQAVEAFPKDSRPYALLVSLYQELREFEKAEAVYLKVTREFGQHPRTMLNLARLYMAWNKKDKAFEAANQVLRKEPGNAEAREIREKAG